MHSAWRTQRSWAICALLTGTLLVSAKPALAQKFARRPRASAAPVAEEGTDESEGPELVAAAPSKRGVQFRSPKTLSHQSPPRVLELAAVPQWQRSPASRFRPTSKRMLRQDGPQDIELPLNRSMRNGGEVIVEEGTPAEGEMVGPGTVDGQMIDGVQDGDIIYEDGGIYEDDEFDPWGGGFDGGCDDCGDYGWAHPCDGICIPRHRIDETSLFIGPQAFRGPVDLGRNGNFGFHEGVNFAGQFGRLLGLGPLGIGYQIGATFVQSNFSGDTVIPPGETKGRDQQFITAGLFRRAHGGSGLQGGVVYDWLHDNYYVKFNVGQVRAELSYLTCCGHEFGFWGAFHAKTWNTFVSGIPTTFQTIDMYNAFYRYNLPNGSQARIWGGGTGNNLGIVGADFRIPITNRWDFTGAFNYLIAQGAGPLAASRDAWGLGVNLVWFPGRRCQGIHNTPFRALFTPADNTTLITNFRQP